MCSRPVWQDTPKGPCSWWRYRSRFILYLSSHHQHSSCSDNLLQSIKQALIWSYHPAKNFHFNWQGAPFITGGVSMCSLTAGERDTGKLFRRCPVPENKNAAKPLQPRPTENRRPGPAVGFTIPAKSIHVCGNAFGFFSKKRRHQKCNIWECQRRHILHLCTFCVFFSLKLTSQPQFQLFLPVQKVIIYMEFKLILF